ncbi:hypothetical protein GOA99_18605 [Sinorhizobium meliloti]|nr:hypothetical protein [Sinorhizobium meliloti]
MKRNNLILIPIPMLVLAVFPMPYSFYGVLRTVVFVAACFLAEREYRKTKDFNGWALAFCGIALLFNPIIPNALSRDSWFIFDIAAGGIFYYTWLKSGPDETAPPHSQ